MKDTDKTLNIIVLRACCERLFLQVQICDLTKIKQDYQEINYSDWVAAEIQAKIHEVYPETYELFLPHNIGLVDLDAVSFEKGCFRGQEIIVRMEHRGNIKRTVECYEVEIDTTPKPGEKIQQGTVIRAVRSSTGNQIILHGTSIHFYI